MKTQFFLLLILSLSVISFPHARADSPKLSQIRSFLSTLVGTQVLTGDPACASLKFTKLAQGQGDASQDSYYDMYRVNFSEGTSNVQTFLYSSNDYAQLENCTTVSATTLQCQVSRTIPTTGVFSFENIKTSWELTKDPNGELIGFNLTQNKSPQLNIICSEPTQP
jgi:hypothetical protein